ncbi:toxin glutamine deamidase domain-containing protein, partial [Streptomyces sp. NPDC052013]|uniref:toxin glutamine deamidase domain-containing protein n=1 Tax=Streptomyces sp. NPDC052013 TaxID=3365679 RepID=UPI0037D7636F
ASANDPVGAVERGLDIADTVISLQQLQNSLEGHINTPAPHIGSRTMTAGAAENGTSIYDTSYGKGTPSKAEYFNDVNIFGGTANCQCTAVAGAAILEGRPAVALNLKGEYRMDAIAPTSISNLYGKDFIQVSTKPAAAALDIAAKFGNGAVGIVSLRLGGSPKHAINFRVENGRAVFYDFQMSSNGRTFVPFSNKGPEFVYDEMYVMPTNR